MPCDSVACVKMCDGGGGDGGDGESDGSSIPCVRKYGCTWPCHLCDDKRLVAAD